MIAPALNQLRIAREILHEANGEPRHMAEATPVTEFDHRYDLELIDAQSQEQIAASELVEFG